MNLIQLVKLGAKDPRVGAPLLAAVVYACAVVAMLLILITLMAENAF